MQKKSSSAATVGVVGLLLVTLGAACLFLGLKDASTLLVLGIASMVPIALGATGELLCERAGMFNVGIEGMMLLSAFGSVWGARLAGHWSGGIVAAMFVGMLLGGAFGYLTTRGRADQLLLGLGLNIFAQGIVALLLLKVFKTFTFYRVPEYLRVPQLSLGDTTFSAFSIVGLLLAVGMYILVSRTRFGLRARAVGLAPFVADTLGVDPYAIRTAASVVGGVLAGLSGAYISLDWVGLISITVIQGRGFMALACVKFGGLNAIRIFAGALLFGVLLAASMWLQNVPAASGIMRQGGSYLFLMLPYLVVVLTISFFPYQEPLTKKLGVPYRRE